MVSPTCRATRASRETLRSSDRRFLGPWPADRQRRSACTRHPPQAERESGGAAYHSGTGGGAHQPPLRDDQSRTEEPTAGIRYLAALKGPRQCPPQLGDADLARSQTCVPQRKYRSPHGGRSRRRASRPILLQAGASFPPRSSRNALRPPRPDHCASDREHLSTARREIPVRATRRRARRSVRRPIALRQSRGCSSGAGSSFRMGGRSYSNVARRRREGYPGLEDGVDYHWGMLFKAAVLSKCASGRRPARATTATARSSRRSRRGGQERQPNRPAGRRPLAQHPAEDHHPAGFPVRVMVTRDLVLEPTRLRRSTWPN